LGAQPQEIGQILAANELLDNVAAPKYSAGKVKGTFAISNPYSPMIELGNIHSRQGCDRAGQRVSWSFIARNFRHVDLYVEPVRIAIIGQVGLAAGSDLNSSQPFSSVLASGVESATCMLSFVILPVVDFDDVGNDDQFEKSGESVDTEITAEGFHDPNKL
jgi:hypothetical protein